MTHPESALAGLYDHEAEDRPAGRRRQAPDWGGDDLFTSMPSRTFQRPSREEVARVEAGIEHLDWTPRVGRTSEAAGTTRASAVSDWRLDTLEHPVQRPQRPPVSLEQRRRSPLELPDVTERTIPLPESPAPSGADGRSGDVTADGRRTVTITGHPDRLPARRRPAPSLDERLYGGHPERIAMYAFALGLLLIVIAFLSANA